MSVSISIVTCSFNQAEFLEATLRSVLDQNYSNLEFIVIDGGSTDGSVEILERYADRLSYWVSQPDAGQTDALIKGFARASGDVLAWLNSDDLYEPDTLHEVAAHFAAHPEDRFVYGDATWIDREGSFLSLKREIPYNRFVWLNSGNYIPQPSTFWRRDLYEQVGGLDRNFDLAMDADLWARFAEVSSPRHVRRLWSRMRHYPEQKNRRLRQDSDTEGRRIQQRYGVPGGSSSVRAMATHAAARGVRICYKLAMGCYRTGTPGLSR